MNAGMKPTKKVAYITSMKKGLPSFVDREIREVKKSGVQVRLFATKYAPGPYMPVDPVYRMRPLVILARHCFYPFLYGREYLRSLGTAVSTRSMIEFLVACDFAAQMQAEGVTHIHCVEGLMAFNIGYYCKRLLGLPLSVTIYADGLYIAPSPRMFATALAAADAVVTICDHNRKMLLEKFGVPPEKIHLVPVVLDTESYRPRKLIHILIVAQFAERKGHRYLFEAIRALNLNNVEVWVVGGRGSDKTYVDVPLMVREMHLEDKVVLWGNVTEPVLQSLYEACDIFCLPSVSAIVPEGTPVALMEAMAYEKPVVTTRHAGIPEYVEEVLVAERDIDGLAGALSRLIEDPTERRRQGIRNREIIARKFSTQGLRDLMILFEH